VHTFAVKKLDLLPLCQGRRALDPPCELRPAPLDLEPWYVAFRSLSEEDRRPKSHEILKKF